MNQILEWLDGGDPRSDGSSDEVVELVLSRPQLMGDLSQGLDRPEDLIRGRVTDVLEKIARSRPDLVVELLPKLTLLARKDSVPMVKLHVAMILGHLAIYEEHLETLLSALLDMLSDRSVFARSWAIASLCILARLYPDQKPGILGQIGPLQSDGSIAIRTRTRKALHLLTNEAARFPKCWVKSEHILSLWNG